jgi:hypothetical protein
MSTKEAHPTDTFIDRQAYHAQDPSMTKAAEFVLDFFFRGSFKPERI